VRYGRLVDIGRGVVEKRAPRAPWQSATRAALAFGLPRTWLFGAALALGQSLRPLLPPALKEKVPPRATRAGARPAVRRARKVLALAGCVQPVLAPNINAAAARLLDRVWISLVEAPRAGCCGAVRFHLNRQEAGLEDMRTVIDAWWPMIEAGEVEAIAMTASGCGATVRDYGHFLAHDPRYRDKAARVAALTRDLSEIVAAEASALERELPRGARRGKVAFQSPCSLQHGQQIRGVVERLLAIAGWELTPVPDGHLCCGSAGTYSILQPELSQGLRRRKLAALGSGEPDCVATANIGCLAHLQAATKTPVRHWIELVDEALA
jgi:glycolate oxidase iron-sulfur subunit